MATGTLQAALHLDLAAVEQGIPLATLARLISKSGLSNADIHAVVLPARTLKHRKARREPLNTDESDKLVRLVRVFDQAVRVYGSAERARHWLDTPKQRFDGRTPLQMLNTDLGARMVEEMLGQIDHGMFA